MIELGPVVEIAVTLGGYVVKSSVPHGEIDGEEMWSDAFSMFNTKETLLVFISKTLDQISETNKDCTDNVQSIEREMKR